MDRFDTFTGSVLELNRLLQRLKETEMKPLGLRANHVMCLYHLGKAPQGLTAAELTRACREDKAAVSRCIAQLTSGGSCPPRPRRTDFTAPSSPSPPPGAPWQSSSIAGWIPLWPEAARV